MGTWRRRQLIEIWPRKRGRAVSAGSWDTARLFYLRDAPGRDKRGSSLWVDNKVYHRFGKGQLHEGDGNEGNEHGRVGSRVRASCPVRKSRCGGPLGMTLREVTVTVVTLS